MTNHWKSWMYTTVSCINHTAHISGLGPSVSCLLCIFAPFRRMLTVSLYLFDPGSDQNRPVCSARWQQQQETRPLSKDFWSLAFLYPLQWCGHLRETARIIWALEVLSDSDNGQQALNVRLHSEVSGESLLRTLCSCINGSTILLLGLY